MHFVIRTPNWQWPWQYTFSCPLRCILFSFFARCDRYPLPLAFYEKRNFFYVFRFCYCYYYDSAPMRWLVVVCVQHSKPLWTMIFPSCVLFIVCIYRINFFFQLLLYPRSLFIFILFPIFHFFFSLSLSPFGIIFVSFFICFAFIYSLAKLLSFQAIQFYRVAVATPQAYRGIVLS